MNIIPESELCNFDSIEITKYNDQCENPQEKLSTCGTYYFSDEDLSAELLLNRDFTYSLQFSGSFNSTENGTWEIHTHYLFLKRKKFQSYFRFVNIEPNRSAQLIVHDIESKKWIPAHYQAWCIWGSKKGYVDSMIVLPRSTSYIQIKSPSYPTVGFSVKNIKGKRVEVFVSRKFTHFEKDSFRIFPNRLFHSNEIVFQKKR